MGFPAHKQHPRYFPRVKQRLLQSWFKVSRQQFQITTTKKNNKNIHKVLVLHAQKMQSVIETFEKIPGSH